MKQPPLAAGQRAKIFQRPATDEDFEGIATLRKCVGSELGAYERWQVVFDDEPDYPVERSVCPDHVAQVTQAAADMAGQEV